MLDFEEELKKFQPSLEVEELGDAIYQDDLTDMTDLFKRSDRTDEAGRSTVNCGKEKRLQFTGKNSGMESLSAV